MENTQKWFHATGVCGKATSNIAIMFQKMGWFVTGTDVQFLSPAKDNLDNNNIPYVEGYHFTHLQKSFWEKELGRELPIPEHPDLALIVESASAKNKEYLYAKVHGIDMRPYSQIFTDYLVKEHSIVIIGSAGKTTTSALTVYVLKELGLDPSYMVAGDAVNLEEGVVNTNSKWSVLEGDEYHNKELSNGAKFLEYKPKYLLITNIGWEHQEIFPTKELYLEEFEKAVKLVPADGVIFALAGDENIDKIVREARCKVIRYGYREHKNADFRVGFTKNADATTQLEIVDARNETVLHTKTNLIGEYNYLNITALTALLIELIHEHKIPNSVFNRLPEIIAKFAGVKKRLEILYSDPDLIIIDDFSIAPDRMRNTLATLNKEFSDFTILVVFEPNAGSRPTDEVTFKKIYKDAFVGASEIIIPELSEFNADLLVTDLFITYLKDLEYPVRHIETSQLLNYIQEYISNANEKVLVLFASAYRLTSHAQELVKQIRK